MYNMSSTASAFERLPVSGPVIVLDCRYPKYYQQPAHVDRWDRISIVMQGKVKEIVGKQEVYGTTTGVVVKPGHVQHANDFGPEGARLISLVFPPKLVQQLQLTSFFEQLYWQQSVSITKNVMVFIKALQHSEDLLSEVLDLISLLTAELDYKKQKAPDWLSQILEYIQDQPDHNPSVCELAQLVDVHPVYLARVFRRFKGCNVKAFIHWVKMREVFQQLLTTDKPIVQIALDLGFADQSHMNRIFKAYSGYSPYIFRKSLQ